MILVSVQPGQEVLTTITAELARQGVRDGAIVSLIGTVGMCRVSTAEAVTEYVDHIDISGNGEVRDGAPRLHVVLSRQGERTRSGLLQAAMVDRFLVHAYVLPL